MGLRGPAPKPTEVRIAEGSRAHRPLPQNEPQYASGIPAKPKGMTKRAGVIWDELVKEMANARVLKTVDQRALWQLAEDEALLAEAYDGLSKAKNGMRAMAKKAAADTAGDGNRSGPLHGGPLWWLLASEQGRRVMVSLKDIAARVIVERREFGLTPSSRTRIQADFDNERPAAAADSIELKLCG